MAKTLLDLAKRLEARADTVSTDNSARAIAVATEIVTILANTTPVDESTALSNWQVELGRPAGVQVAAFVLGKKGSTKGASASETIAAAIEKLKAKQPGQSILISNLVPWIRPLNEGSSSQAPAGFVEKAILIARHSGGTVKVVRTQK